MDWIGTALAFKEAGYLNELADIQWLTLKQIRLFSSRIRQDQERQRINAKLNKSKMRVLD